MICEYRKVKDYKFELVMKVFWNNFFKYVFLVYFFYYELYLLILIGYEV